ncbi:MAG: DUF4097 family beta strand repeat-containing protein [Acidimicrobiales bacterium]
MDDMTPLRVPEAVRISSTSHRVTVIGEARSDVSVDGDARVYRDDVGTTVVDVAGTLTIRVPEGTSIVIGSSSGRVEVSGPIGDIAVLTDSGRIDIAEAASVDARTTSGRVQIGTVDGTCRVSSVSGRIHVGGCGSASVATDSGRVSLEHVAGPVEAHCVSGRIDVSLDSAHDVAAETVTGRVTVSMPSGVEVFESTESTAVIRPPDCDCTVSAQSVSGRIDVSNR